MRITVKIKPGAGYEAVEKGEDGQFVVAVKEPPVDGKANRAMQKALAEYFDVAPSRIRIVSGHIGRIKIVEIL